MGRLSKLGLEHTGKVPGQEGWVLCSDRAIGGAHKSVSFVFCEHLEITLKTHLCYCDGAGAKIASVCWHGALSSFPFHS